MEGGLEVRGARREKEGGFFQRGRREELGVEHVHCIGQKASLRFGSDVKNFFCFGS